MKKTMMLTLALLLVAGSALAAGFIRDAALDAALTDVRSNSTVIEFLSSPPSPASDYSNLATKRIAQKTGLTTGSFGAIGAGTPNGRSFTINQVTSIQPSANGTIAYWCLTNGSSIIYACGDMTSNATVATTETWQTGNPAATVRMPAAQ